MIVLAVLFGVLWLLALINLSNLRYNSDLKEVQYVHIIEGLNAKVEESKEFIESLEADVEELEKGKDDDEDDTEDYSYTVEDNLRDNLSRAMASNKALVEKYHEQTKELYRMREKLAVVEAPAPVPVEVVPAPVAPVPAKMTATEEVITVILFTVLVGSLLIGVWAIGMTFLG